MIDGDARSAAIAAASVIAKVTRDRYMHRIADAYPVFGFDGNVGYSTPEHRAAIIEHGPSELHRRSFALDRLLAAAPRLARARTRPRRCSYSVTRPAASRRRPTTSKRSSRWRGTS